MHSFLFDLRSVLKDRVVQYFLGALLLIGLGYIAILPPFEGFDETAHFSRIREIKTSWLSIFERTSFMDNAIIQYQGPLPYSSGSPPYNRGNTYPNFFSEPEKIDSYRLNYKTQAFGVDFDPTIDVNWQNQHPPLYYLLMAPLLAQLSQYSLIYQLDVLRFFSFLMALAGVLLGLMALKHYVAKMEDRPYLLGVLGFVVYPIIFPMFFVEFARIGNDALCVLIAGALSYLLALFSDGKVSYRQASSLGVLLGLGLLTKAFFIPITVGILFFILLGFLKDGLNYKNIKKFLFMLLFSLIPLVILAGSFYLFKFLYFGDLGLGGEVGNLAEGKGFVSGFMQNFSLWGLIRGSFVPFVSFSWAGSWSLTRMPVITQIPLLVLGGWIFLEYLHRLRLKPPSSIDWLPVILFLLMYLGLVIHVVVSLALSGLGTSGGWYLHILTPWVAPMIGLVVMTSILEAKFKKIFFLLLISYGFVFQVAAIWSHMSLFSACAIKDDDKSFAFTSAHFCLDHFSEVMGRLDVLAYPYFGIVSLSFGLGLLFYLAFHLCYKSN